MERRTYTVEEVARILGVGRNTAYQAVQRGEIQAVKIGRRYVVPRGVVEQILAVSTIKK